MSANHTPGPWKVEADPNAGGDHPNHASRFVTYGPEGFDEEGMMERGCGIVCELRDTVEIKQNAALISAAPDLLRALEEAESTLAKYADYADAMKEFCGRGCDPMSKGGYRIQSLYAMIANAILKAKGNLP